MKTRRTFIAFVLCATFLFTATSCVVVTPGKAGHPKKGWSKNSNNPHHPNTTNPGHTKGKSKN